MTSSIDVLIRGGRVVDGTGNPWTYADVAISGDRIAAIEPPGRIPAEAAREVVDAAGLVVAPGFIDIQSHSIIPLMVDGRCLSKIMQGVTTEIMGEAWTPAPVGGKLEGGLRHTPYGDAIAPWREKAKGWTRFGNWLDAQAAAGVSPNIGSFLGGGALRQYGRGMAMGRATADELATMKRVLAESMEDGAFGVSYALIYPPDAYVDTDELVEVCSVLPRYGGVYITHIRSEANGLLEGIDEAIEIGRRAGAPVEVYHLKAAGRSNWHKMPELIARIERARAQGIDVTADMYPYTASGTGLTSVLPPWISADGKLFDNLRDPAMRARVTEEVLHPSGEWEAMGRESSPEGIMPVGFEQPENKQYAGKRLSEIAEMRGQSWIDAAIDLLISENQRISTIYFMMSEENVKLGLQQTWNKVSTDAGGLDPAWATPVGPVHPRAYGTYPRVLGKYVRDEGVLTLEDAVRKMTSAVADRLGLRERGRLAAGSYADVVAFDPATIGDRATFESPHQLAEGVREVWVNGTRVVQGGAHTGALPGRVVRGPGAR
ncbi:MAG TPA: D-aminoacylase [Thermomicrobiaceae bacterium]|nr:D-aminoacylase [Thermomicrobiaceae bacterium]